MNRLPTKGYDPLVDYSVEELKTMYIREGLTEAEAISRAVTVKNTIHRLNKGEQRMWNNVREHEIPVGLSVNEL